MPSQKLRNNSEIRDVIDASVLTMSQRNEEIHRGVPSVLGSTCKRIANRNEKNVPLVSYITVPTEDDLEIRNQQIIRPILDTADRTKHYYKFDN